LVGADVSDHSAWNWGANEIGYKNVFPGSYGVRASTLRTVFMDLATQLGEQGFRWVFIVHGHGSPLHNQALDQADDYFRDSFGGRMVNLDGLLPKPIRQQCPPLFDTLFLNNK
jgi:hypothetical protein